MLTAKLDAREAIARFDSARGIPVSVREALRPALIGLTQRLGAKVEKNLNTGLKSRTSLIVRKELVEDANGVVGRVTTVSSRNPLLPLWLEEGTRAHAIEARNAKALYFFWEKLGVNVAFKRVMHPGFAGIHYTVNAFSEMEDEIKSTINRAVADGLGERRAGQLWLGPRL